MGYHEVKHFQNKHTQEIRKMSKYLRAHGKPWIERVLTPYLFIIYPRTQNILKKGFFSSFSFSMIG